MTRLAHLLLVLCALCALCACEGDTGPTGPQGEQGLQGETGAQGLPGNVEAFDLIEQTIASSDYTTGSGFLILDARISLASYVDTYVFASSLAFPAYLRVETYGEQMIGDTAAHPYVAVFAGGLVVRDPDRALLGQQVVVVVLPE